MQNSLAWLAGVIDGEGSIGIWKANKNGWLRPTVTIPNTNNELMIYAASILETLGVEFKLRICKDRRVKKQCGRIDIHERESVAILLNAVEEHLVAKKAQARIVLDCLAATVFGKHHQNEVKDKYRRLLTALNNPESGFSVETVHRALGHPSEEPVRTAQECAEADRNDLPDVE